MLSATVIDTTVRTTAASWRNSSKARSREDHGGQASRSEPTDKRHRSHAEVRPIEGDGNGSHSDDGQNQNCIAQAAPKIGTGQAQPEHGSTKREPDDTGQELPALSDSSKDLGSSRCRNIPKHSPARNAATNPFPCRASARAYVPIATAGVAMATVPDSVHCLRLARARIQPVANPTPTPMRIPTPISRIA